MNSTTTPLTVLQHPDNHQHRALLTRFWVIRPRTVERGGETELARYTANRFRIMRYQRDLEIRVAARRQREEGMAA